MTTSGVWTIAVRGYRIVRGALIDLRHGALLGGMVPTRYAHLGAHSTANTDYLALDRIFGGRIGPADVLVDVGCGRGRVINWWLGQGLRNRIVGIELDERIAAQARRRLRRSAHVTILTGDAVELLPEDGTLFYLFNPFAAPVVEALKQRLARVAESHDLAVLYYRPKHVDVFERDPRWAIERVDLGGGTAFPFDPLAVIRPRRMRDNEAARGMPAPPATEEGT